MKFKWSDLDLTKELEKAGQIVSAEIRRSINQGRSADSGVSLPINAPSTIRQKRRTIGQSKPLVAEHKSFITLDSYEVKSDRNSAKITLSNAPHPSGNATISEIGVWNNNGTSKIPARPFFGITDKARKDIMVMMINRIKEIVRGK